VLRKAVLGGVWLSFVGYNVWLNPLGRPYTWQVGSRLITFQLGEVNSYLVAIFWLMGVWPMIYACLMFADGRMQKVSAWPFFLGANFLGMLWLMPYLLLRQRQQTFVGEKDFWIDWLDRRSTGRWLLAIALLLIVYALLTGDWAEFVYLFQHRAFVHLITLDWLLMGLVFPLTTLFPDDMARRHLASQSGFWAVALVPLLGPLLYLCWRPPLAVPESETG
jgi:hypothetical protein